MSWPLSTPLFVLALWAAGLQGCATVDRDAAHPSQAPVKVAPEGALVLFPSEFKSDELPSGWEKWILHPLKRRTDYGFKRDRSGVFVEAKARSSASGLIRRLDLNPRDYDVLEFSWMVDKLLEGADAADRDSEDSPVRVVLAFDGNKASLPIKERAFFERIKLFTGQDMPYATLMYIWDNQRPLNTLIANPHTSRVQKLVASSGTGGLKTWQSHRRNIVEDYRKAYGQAPGRLIGIAIMTDTDNTRTTTQARYRDLILRKSETPAR